MDGFQQILDKLDIPIKTKPPKEIIKKNNIDSTLPFSDDEAKKLEREMLGLDTVYNEPKFENRTQTEKKLSPTPHTTPSTENHSKEILSLLHQLEKRISRLDKKIEINAHTVEANEIKISEMPQPLEIVKLMISKVDNQKNAIYQLQTQRGIEEILLSEYYEMSKFITMTQQYQHALTLDKNLIFSDKDLMEYKNYLVTISQNLMANSFRFFEKSTLLDEIIILGQKIKKRAEFLGQTIEKMEAFFEEIKESLTLPEYKKQYFFSTLLNERGAILNAIIIIDEMLGEYIIFSARNLSPLANEKIQKYIDNITLTASSRKSYYYFHKSVKEFFSSHFSLENERDKSTFFPFKESANSEIERQMNKLFNANKMNKSHLFNAYANLIARVNILRNDLAHGNIVKIHKDIQQDITHLLVDFNYLAIEKDILN